MWLKRLFSRRRLYGELSEEIRGHLEEKIEELVASGMSRKEATYAARREFGNVTLIEEDSRDAWRWPSIENFFMDVRYGLRMLRKSPGFTTAAVLTIALGIGANAAIIGLVDSAFLRGLPFHEPERLVHIWVIEADGDLHTPTPAVYQAVLEGSKSFEQIAAQGWADYFLDSDGSVSQNLPGLLVTPNWLPALGIQPLLGRNFREEEEVAGQDAVVMLSYNCWRAQFHGDPYIAGKQIVLNRRAVTVIGVEAQPVDGTATCTERQKGLHHAIAAHQTSFGTVQAAEASRGNLTTSGRTLFPPQCSLHAFGRSLPFETIGFTKHYDFAARWKRDCKAPLRARLATRSGLQTARNVDRVTESGIAIRALNAATGCLQRAWESGHFQLWPLRQD